MKLNSTGVINHHFGVEQGRPDFRNAWESFWKLWEKSTKGIDLWKKKRLRDGILHAKSKNMKNDSKNHKLCSCVPPHLR